MRQLRQVRWAVGVAGIALVASACGGGSSTPKAGSTGGAPSAGATGAGGDAGSGTVSINISDPEHLLPGNTADTNGSEVLDALFTGLVRFDNDNKPQLTDLTESIDTTDNTVYDIKIRPGWSFANGEPLTVQNFIDAWNYAALSTNGQQNGYFFTNVKGYKDVSPDDPNPDDAKAPEPTAQTMSGLEKVSDTELKVTLSVPDNTFKIALGYTAFYPVPKAMVADPKAFEEAPIGNGPFKMDGKWEHGKAIKVVRNTAYAGATKPHIAGIDYKIYAQAETAYNELVSGGLDVLTQVPPSDLARAKTDLGDSYKDFDSSLYGMIGFPVFDPNYKDVNVRKAISMSIDRATIMKTVFSGSRVAADDFVSPIVPGYRKGGCGEGCTYDPTKAKAMFDASPSKPASVQLVYNADGGHKEWMEAACNNVQQALGVQCTAKAQDKFATLLSNLRKAAKTKQTFGAFRLGWIMDYPSAQDYLGPLYGTTGGSNYFGYSNKEFDSLVTKGQSASEADSVGIYQQADDILAKEFPAAPIYFGAAQVGWSKKVTDVRLDAYDRVDKFLISVK